MTLPDPKEVRRQARTARAWADQLLSQASAMCLNATGGLTCNQQHAELTENEEGSMPIEERCWACRAAHHADACAKSLAETATLEDPHA